MFQCMRILSRSSRQERYKCHGVSFKPQTDDNDKNTSRHKVLSCVMSKTPRVTSYLATSMVLFTGPVQITDWHNITSWVCCVPDDGVNPVNGYYTQDSMAGDI